jgi:N-acetylglucosamine kinase-like BadF-type ATPase
MQQLLVGVDAGGTQTVAAARCGQVLRTIHGGPANPNVAGVEQSADEIGRCVEAVLDGATAAVVVAGVAGAGTREMCAALEARLARRFPASLLCICHDARIALRAVFPRGDGIVAIAGTGAIVYAEVATQTFRAGGEGYRNGDPGSGYAIGLAGLRESAGMPVAHIAAYAPTVLREAAAGDARAAAILDENANALYRMIEEVALRCPPETPLAFAGGLLRERNLLTDMLERCIADGALPVRVVARRVEPYYGALALAAQIAAA